MTEQTRTVTPIPNTETYTARGEGPLTPPAGWVMLPPGDAALTRRVKAGGPHWVVQEARGRKIFSRGVLAPAERIETLRAQLEIERAKPAYAKKLEAGRRRREREQDAYVGSFQETVRDFLNFAQCYAELADRLAEAVARHATPVGSGTVARTQRIPIEQRAESAVIAWMRHQTTAYDHMSIPRQKGKRREVRRMLAQQSRQLLENYRAGHQVNATKCPLQRALADADK